MSFTEVTTFVQENIKSNQFFQGAVGAAIIGGVLFQAKSFINTVFQLLLRTTSVSISVSNESEEHFARINNWILEEGIHKSTRNLEVKTKHDDFNIQPKLYDYKAGVTYETDNQTKSVSYVTPNDYYYTIYNFLPVKVTYTAKESQMTREIKRQVNIVFYFRGIKFLERIKKKIEDFVFIKEKKSKTTSIKIFSNINDNFDWDVESYPAKDLNTIFLTKNKTKFIENDIKSFINNKELYTKMGKTYKRNYILMGPPGTGKSSLARAMAAMYNGFLNVAITSGTDKEFLESVKKSNHGVILMEDIDCAKFSLDRTGKDTTSISLSSLLNVLDGAYTKENTITVVTTNNPETLDPAITRPGRVDAVVELGYFSEEEADEFLLFFEDLFSTKLHLSHKDFSKVRYGEHYGFRPCDLSEKVFEQIKNNF